MNDNLSIRQLGGDYTDAHDKVLLEIARELPLSVACVSLVKIMQEVEKDMQTGQNISPEFDSVDEMFEHLEKTA